MKMFVVACFFAIVALTSARPEGDEHYTDKYDNVNVEEIIGNRRLLMPYVKCLLDQGKCSPEGKELKSHIQEALENYCGKCTDVQRERTRQVIGHLINHEQESWEQIVQKYDPERKYTKKYEDELKKLQS